MRNPFMLAIAAVFLSIFITNPATAQAVDRTVREADCGPRYQVREAGVYVGCQNPAAAPGVTLESVVPAASPFTRSPASASVIDAFASVPAPYRDCVSQLRPEDYRLDRNRLPRSVMLLTEDGPELVSGIDAFVRIGDERTYVCMLIENVTGCERLVNMPDSRRASLYYTRPSARALRGTAPELAAAREAGYFIDRDTLYELRRDRVSRCRQYLSWWRGARIFPDERSS